MDISYSAFFVVAAAVIVIDTAIVLTKFWLEQKSNENGPEDKG